MSTIYDHKHICLVGNHVNPLGIIRSLGEEGIKPIVLLCSEEKSFVRYSKYIGQLYEFKTFIEGFEFMIRNYGNEPLKPFVYNGSDDVSLLLDNHYEELKDHFYFSHGQGRLKKYLQKYDITQLALECGINIPKEELLEVGTLPKGLKYPVITKAATSAAGDAWKNQSFICENEAELIEAYDRIKADYILVQEYIHKKNELCIDGISINGGEHIYMPYGCSYFHLSPKSFGEYMFFSPVKDKDLIKRITDIIRGAKYTGIFCVEFLVDQNDELYFLEVNFRHSGWGYFFTYAGFNLPVRWAKATLATKIDVSDFHVFEYFTAMSEFEEYSEYVLTGNRTLRQFISDVKNTDVFLYYNKKDLKPFLFKIPLFVRRRFGASFAGRIIHRFIK